MSGGIKMRFDKQTSLKDIFSLDEFAPMKGLFIASENNFFTGDREKLTVEGLQRLQKTWAASDMLVGLERLYDVARTEEQYVFPIYNSEETARDQHRKQAQLIWLPTACRTTNTFALLMAGGAYGAVCTMVESLPVAAQLNELGMDCFCLSYRTASADSSIHGLMPAPLDDMAAALRFIQTHPNVFHLDTTDYVAGGFSAGGHLAATWGTVYLGARKYGLPQPKTLLLGYPLLSFLNIPAGPTRDYIMQGLFGTGYNSRLAFDYSPCLHVDEAYPPVYLVKAKDDDAVPDKDAADMEASLLRQRVPYCFDIAQSGGHGFGLGSETPARDWVKRALIWMDGLKDNPGDFKAIH